jgi:hypothetical protein
MQKLQLMLRHLQTRKRYEKQKRSPINLHCIQRYELKTRKQTQKQMQMHCNQLNEPR